MSNAPTGRPKYAVVERERRWLVEASVAAGVARRADVADTVSIADRYVRGTRLRLRTVTAYDGAVVTKLGHKAVVDPTPPQRIEHTSLYLDSAESDLLASLPADELAKDRHRIRHDGRTLALDVFTGRHSGLVLAELDLGARDDTAVTPPPFPVVAEVTADHAFTGGALAATTRGALVVLLAGYGVILAAPPTV
jgi:CYTH domain-containing protein